MSKYNDSKQARDDCYKYHVYSNDSLKELEKAVENIRYCVDNGYIKFKHERHAEVKKVITEDLKDNAIDTPFKVVSDRPWEDEDYDWGQ